MRRSRSSSRFAAILLVVATLASFGGTAARGVLPLATRLEAGRLLVARPGMVDPNFARAVVLLVSYGEEGAVGVIVNRPTRIALSAVLPELEALSDSGEVVFSGGPVAVNRLLFLFRAAAPPAGCHSVLDDLCAGASLELLEEALEDEQSVTDFRGFAGHAGWAPGQLEWEIEQRGWYVVPGDSERLFDGDSDDLWSDLVHIAESPMA